MSSVNDVYALMTVILVNLSYVVCSPEAEKPYDNDASIVLKGRGVGGFGG